MNNKMLPVLGKQYFPFSDKNAYISLADGIGCDTTIAERARTSYGRDGKSMRQLRLKLWAERLGMSVIDYDVLNPGDENVVITLDGGERVLYKETNEDMQFWHKIGPELVKAHKNDASLIRALMRDGHTSPFEMVDLVFLVQVPMDCWRQWVRHRTASINEYSTRYMEALDYFQVTSPGEWRLQATDNKQGSSGYLTDWERDEYEQLIGTPEQKEAQKNGIDPGEYLSYKESDFHSSAKELYEERLALGIAREQARKDLPLSTYTRAYWKCDLHNIFNFLRLRMDSHAQLEIRSFANCMFEIVKQVCPVACEAFEDYVLHAKRFSKMEMEIIKRLLTTDINNNVCQTSDQDDYVYESKPASMTDREWKEFLAKLS